MFDRKGIFVHKICEKYHFKIHDKVFQPLIDKNYQSGHVGNY